ncbi:MAG: class I SAM-dependent methyltransferase [Verrucomicrobia bacterium]|nr:class I SAM-dependent methyltransferase [Verrucomicrobiota bacterium]
MEFVCEAAPLPKFRNILDACCGMGRHACALAKRGYSVIGIDRDADAVAKARGSCSNVRFVAADVLDYESGAARFDAVIVMGQSFGHFDTRTNRDVLARLARTLRKDGRIILDLWNREFFLTHQGGRELKTPRGIVWEDKRVDGDRLFVKLNYPDRAEERFEWQLFNSSQMSEVAKSVGLFVLLACTNFKKEDVPSPSDSRIQVVLETVGLRQY